MTRFSLITLMAVVAIVAVTFAALRTSSDIWASVLFNIVIWILFTSVLGAIYSVKDRRAFWVGFAVLGWGYWFLAHLPWVSKDYLLSNSLVQSLHSGLQRTSTQTVTSTQTMSANPAMGSTVVIGPGWPNQPAGTMGQTWVGSAGGPPVTFMVGPSIEQVSTVCHSWLTIAFAIAGGYLARKFATR